MEELAGLLSRERLLLELLLFKLITLRQLLVSGEARFLHWAAEEVDRATGKVRQAELHRSVLVAGMAADRGLGPDELSLRVLAEDAPDPWRAIFTDHRRGFQRLAAEVEENLAATRRLAVAGSASVTETLDRLAGGPAEPVTTASTYGPGARWDSGTAAPRVLRTL